MESWPAKPVMLTGHAARIFEQTAKSLAVNLIFCLFVKIKSHSLTENHMRISISSLFFQLFDQSENENWRSKNFFGSAGHCVWPLPKIYFERPCYWHKVCCKGNDIICSKKGRAVKIKEVVHCICWTRIQSILHIDWNKIVWNDHRSQNGSWDRYSTSDILGDFAGVNNITTNLTEETETGIRISLHRGVPCSFSVPITFKRLQCRVHQDWGTTLINLTMYLFHTLFLASSLKANSFSLLPAGIL